MSPTFEQQVREALGQLYEEWLKESRGKIAMLPWAAPRVAAAIRRSYEMFPWELARQAGMSVVYEEASARMRCEAAALEALRGGA